MRQRALREVLDEVLTYCPPCGAVPLYSVSAEHHVQMDLDKSGTISWQEPRAIGQAMDRLHPARPRDRA